MLWQLIEESLAEQRDENELGNTFFADIIRLLFLFFCFWREGRIMIDFNIDHNGVPPAQRTMLLFFLSVSCGFEYKGFYRLLIFFIFFSGFSSSLFTRSGNRSIRGGQGLVLLFHDGRFDSGSSREGLICNAMVESVS